jgi:hypothetical protein
MALKAALEETVAAAALLLGLVELGMNLSPFGSAKIKNNSSIYEN